RLSNDLTDHSAFCKRTWWKWSVNWLCRWNVYFLCFAAATICRPCFRIKRKTICVLDWIIYFRCLHWLLCIYRQYWPIIFVAVCPRCWLGLFYDCRGNRINGFSSAEALRGRARLFWFVRKHCTCIWSFFMFNSCRCHQLSPIILNLCEFRTHFIFISVTNSL